MEIERIIVVADRGLNTSDNTALLSGKNDDDMKNNDGYVYGQSILGGDKEFKEWVLNQEGYQSDKETDKEIYKGLWEIEESFKIIKSEFKARPVFVKTESHVNAHFLICYVTLVIMRVIEHLLEERFTTKQIRNALCSYACSYLEQNYYMFDYRDEVLDALGTLYGWDLTRKYMSRAEIKKILRHRLKE